MPELWKAPRIVPGVIYGDVPKAIEFLAKAFGFRERADARLTGSGFCLAWMDFGESQIALSTPSRGNESPAKVGKSTQSVKVYVDDVDQHFARAKAAGVRVVTEIEEGFWGGRFYRAADHEGHLWEFSQIGRELASHLWKVPPGIKIGV